MPLPTVAIPTETIEVGGESFKLRGLSRGEAMKLAAQEIDDAAELEIQLLHRALDVTLDEFRAWYEHTPSHVIQTLIGKAMALAGLDGLGNA